MKQHPGSRLTARKLLDARREIGGFLDVSLFSDPVYGILMGLLAAEEEGRTTELAKCAVEANVAGTSAIRWIRVLEERGLVSRYSREGDGEYGMLELTADCRAALHAYIEQVSFTLFA